MKQPGAALIALALCLAPPAQAGNNLNMPPAPAPAQAENASSESASSRAGTAGNQQETMGLSADPSAIASATAEASAKAEAAATAGNLHKDQHAQNPPDFPRQPDAIICAIPGAQPLRIEVPDGRNPTDFCPASRTTARIYHHDPGVSYPLPKSSGGPPPVDLLSLQMEQDNIAKDELRALELRNKTPGQQTSGQPP
jgi:hypothetical protein